jgi:anti-anti-sigma factor
MRSAQSTLALDVRRDPEEPLTVAIRLTGELDITTSPLLQTVVDQVLTGQRTRRATLLVLDMSGVSFADASGISPILMARAVIGRRGGRVELRHCRRGVLRLLRALDLTELATDAPT